MSKILAGLAGMAMATTSWAQGSPPGGQAGSDVWVAQHLGLKVGQSVLQEFGERLFGAYSAEVGRLDVVPSGEGTWDGTDSMGRPFELTTIAEEITFLSEYGITVTTWVGVATSPGAECAVPAAGIIASSELTGETRLMPVATLNCNQGLIFLKILPSD